MDNPTTLRWSTVQKVTISGTSAATTNAVGAQTWKVRLWSDTACHVITGASPTATTSHTPLAASQAEYIDIDPGEKVAFIQQSAGGTGYVTECTK